MDKEKEIKQDKSFETNTDWEWMIGLAVIAGIFGDFGTKHEIEKLKLEQAEMKGKLDILEKIILS